MTNKILLIGPDYYGYNESVSQAFNKLGFISEIFSYKEGLSIGNSILVRGKFIKHNELPSVAIINQAILRKYIEFKPDIVLVIKGTLLSEATLIQLKQSILLLWMMDSVFRFPDVLNKLVYFDHLFMFEKTDVLKLKQINIDSVFLPMAYDESVYYPIINTKKEVDIFFVGSLFDKRLDTFYDLIEEFKGYNLKFFGKRIFTKNKPLKYFLNKSIFPNRNLSPNEINKYYNSSRICLNIHKTQSVHGLNPRFYEILGANSHQIVNNNPLIQELFPNNAISVFSNFDELKHQVKMYLEKGPNESFDNNKTYQFIRDNHTFTNRVQIILSQLQL